MPDSSDFGAKGHHLTTNAALHQKHIDVWRCFWHNFLLGLSWGWLFVATNLSFVWWISVQDSCDTQSRHFHPEKKTPRYETHLLRLGEFPCAEPRCRIQLYGLPRKTPLFQAALDSRRQLTPIAGFKRNMKLAISNLIPITSTEYILYIYRCICIYIYILLESGRWWGCNFYEK